MRNYWWYFTKNLKVSGKWVFRIVKVSGKWVLGIVGAAGLVVVVSAAIGVGFVTHPITTVSLALAGTYIFLVHMAAWEEWKDTSHK